MADLTSSEPVCIIPGKIPRGGSYYRLPGSDWCFPNSIRNEQHAKYLLMAPGRDRAGTIGFRCVMDVAGD